MSEWIVIPNWEKFQHRADRSLPWIKLYVELSGRDDWRQLSLSERGLLVVLWIDYARSKGRIRVLDVGNRAGLTPHYAHVSRHLKALSDAGFIEISDTPPLAHALAREEVEVDKTPPTPPQSGGAKTKSRSPKITGWRLVRGSHGFTHIRDPKGTDKPPADALREGDYL